MINQKSYCQTAQNNDTLNVIGNAVLKGLYYKDLYFKSIELNNILAQQSDYLCKENIELKKQLEKKPEIEIKTNWTTVAVASAISILLSSITFITINNLTTK